MKTVFQDYGKKLLVTRWCPLVLWSESLAVLQRSWSPVCPRLMSVPIHCQRNSCQERGIGAEKVFVCFQQQWWSTHDLTAFIGEWAVRWAKLCVKASALTASPVTHADLPILFATCVHAYLVKWCREGVADLHLHDFNAVRDYLVIMLSYSTKW